MHLDMLVRLIEGTDSSSFRELAMRYLKLSDYSDVVLRDGPGDGGNDMSVWSLGANPDPIAVQLSVQKSGWESKLRKDAQRVVDVHGLRSMIYITSRRISAVAANPLIEQLWSQQNISLRIIDSQALASKFYGSENVGEVFKALGMQGGRGSTQPPTEQNLRGELGYAYAFFGTDVQTFRQSGLERSIIAYVVRQRAAPTREETQDAVAKALRLKGNRIRLVEAAIDRMAQRGTLTFSKDRLRVDGLTADAYKAAKTVRAKQWGMLERALRQHLGNAGLEGSALDRSTATVVEAAGAIVLGSADAASAALQHGGDSGPARNRVRGQLRRVERVLVQSNLDPQRAADLLPELTEIVSSSDFGQTLLAGDLFLSLITMDSSDLLDALGGQESLDVFLDASVAIPMLASLLYEPHDHRHFRAAKDIHEQARLGDFNLLLPHDYLEEAASHLLDAFNRYKPVLGQDADLRFSKNAFVAHFLALQAKGQLTDDFDAYAASFGLQPDRGAERSFTAERDSIMNRMTTLFARYGIAVAEPGTISKQAMRFAQESIAYTARELGLDRSGRLLDHDARAVADISSRAAAGDHAVIFCTWDRLHLRLRTAGGSVAWDALDPVMLADLLALVGEREGEGTASAVDIALEFGEAESRTGAAIWDELVRIETDDLYDAKLLERAQAFKNSFVARQREGDETGSVSDEWTAWKSSQT